MKKILIIDDERMITRALSRALAHDRLEIETASDGQEGLEKFKSFQPDLILLDLLMPKVSGMEVLEKIRSQGSKTPIILMTAYGDAQTQEKAKELGISAYLTKPFNNIEDIITLVHETLR